MQLDQPLLSIKPIEAAITTLIILGGISYFIIYSQMVPHIPIMLALIGLMCYGILKKVKIADLESGMTEGAKSGMGAVLIFFFIGMLVSSWMASGTIPTFVYLAMELVNGKFYFAIVFIVTAFIGISIGSAFTTAATLGVAFISVSTAMGISPVITAGAIVSGAFFGDKMSPLSDTTNLASMVVGVDLFEHIRNMAWTTVPAFFISFILFAFLSPENIPSNFENMKVIKLSLLEMNLVHWYSIIPFLVLAILAIKKVSAIITLSTSILSSLLIAIVVQKGFHLQELLTILYSGYKSESGIKEVDDLLTRGGMESMLFSISLVLLALSMGGLLIRIGILPSLLDIAQKFLRRTSALIGAAAATAIGINFLVGEQYLSILLTGNAYKENFKKAGLEAKNLSRVLEDAGTVINPLVPWGVSGIFMANVLGVSTLDYLPFAFFCLLSPIMTVIFGITGFSISHINQKPTSV